MLQLMRNGGFPMFFILAFGLIALALAARFASRPAREHLALIRAMSSATLFATLTGTVADFGATFLAVSSDQFRNDPAWHIMLVQGLGESMSPGILGFTLLSLTSLLLAVGASRAPEQAA